MWGIYHPVILFTWARSWKSVVIIRSPEGSSRKKVWETLGYSIIFRVTKQKCVWRQFDESKNARESIAHTWCRVQKPLKLNFFLHTYKNITRSVLFHFSTALMGRRSTHFWGFEIAIRHIHSVRILWTNNQPVANECCIWRLIIGVCTYENSIGWIMTIAGTAHYVLGDIQLWQESGVPRHRRQVLGTSRKSLDAHQRGCGGDFGDAVPSTLLQQQGQTTRDTAVLLQLLPSLVSLSNKKYLIIRESIKMGLRETGLKT